MIADEAVENPARQVVTITQLNHMTRELIEGAFPLMWIEGEVSNLSQPASGHWYFSLKDATAQVRCAMFRMRNRLLAFSPENGSHVLVRAQVSLYEARGDFQLIVEHMEEAGDGVLLRAFEALKLRLSREGLFDTRNKKPLPHVPRRIGIITSPTGAAVRDILSVLKRRFPAIPIIIYPVQVQGSSAAQDIAQALKLASVRHECDVLILARGGGSLEDLQAFNEEIVARAIHACTIPVVSGVGHETDVTIADFVADVRAATPSAAAELVSPDRGEWLRKTTVLEARLTTLFQRKLQFLAQRIDGLSRLLRHPRERLETQSRQFVDLARRLHAAQSAHIKQQQHRVVASHAKLLQHAPHHRLRAQRANYIHLAMRIERAMTQRLHALRERLARRAVALETISPLATLNRGYALVRRVDNGAVIHAAHDVAVGDRVETRLAQGRLICSVDNIIEPTTP